MVGLGWLAGCGKGPPASSPRKRPAAASVQELPALADYLPPLDGERIEFAPPSGWDVPPASSSYIVRAQKSPRETYPTIIVTADDFEGIADVSKENVKEFAGQVAAAAGKDKAALTPMSFGESVWVAYRKRAKVRKPVTRILDVLYLETVVGGRKYRLELRCEEGTLEKSQPYAFAVARGIKFRARSAREKPGETAKMQRAPENEPPKAKPPKDRPSTAGPPKEKEKVREAKPGARPAPKEKPKQEPKAGPKAKPKGKAKEEAKKKAKEEGGLELDLDKLDKLLK